MVSFNPLTGSTEGIQKAKDPIGQTVEGVLCITPSTAKKIAQEKQKYMLRERIRSFEIILLVSVIICVGLFKGLEIGSDKLGQYIYSITSENFLVQAPITHKDLVIGAISNKLNK